MTPLAIAICLVLVAPIAVCAVCALYIVWSVGAVLDASDGGKLEG